MSNNKLKGIFLSCLVLMFTPEARSKGYLGISSVNRGANSTNITFSDNRPSREIAQGKTASFGVSAMRFARNTMSLFYSAFSGKPVPINHSEPGVGDGVLYYDLPTSERVGLAMVAMGSVGAVAWIVLDTIGFPEAIDWIAIPAVVIEAAGVIYFAYKSCTEAEQEIDIRPDGVTKFGYLNRSSRLVRKKRGLEGKGTILWPNGIGYEGLFENNLIKNNPNGKLILFPEEDGYTVEFLDAGYAFPNAYYFNNTSYDSENKLLRFADGDIFKGISSENTKGIFLSRSGTEVEDTLRNVLVGKMEEEEKIRKSDPKKETKFILLGRGEDNVIELKGNYRENKKMLEKAAINEYVADSYSKDDGEVILTFDNGDTFVGNLGTEARGTYTFKNGTVVENELLSTVMENMEEKRRVNRKKEENILILRNIFSVSITRIIKGDGYMLFGMSNGYEYILGNGAILENNGEEVLVQAISGTADGTAPRIEFTDKFSEEMEKIGVENSVELLDGIYGSNPYRCFGNICIYVPSSKGDSLYLGDYRAKVDADTSLVTMEPYGYGFHILPDGNVLIVNGEKAEEAEEIFLYSRYGLAVLNGTPVIIDEENYEEKQEGAAPIEDFSAAEEPEDKMEEKTLLQTATTYAWKMNGCATSPLEDGIECTYCSEEEENRSK